MTGNFTDPNLPAGYAPFNVENIANQLYVTYAKQVPGSDDEEDGAGLGFVSVFRLNGDFVGRVASQGPLNAPWGLAVAPTCWSATSETVTSMCSILPERFKGPSQTPRETGWPTTDCGA